MSIKLYKKGSGVNLRYQKLNYAMNRKYKEKIYWRCVNSNCLSRISTNSDRDTFLSGPFPEHNHIEYNNMLEMRRKVLKEIDLKKMKDLGLFIQFMDDPLLNGFLRKFFAIGYLPVFYVRQKFYQLTQSTNARFLKNAYLQLVFFPSTHMVHHFPPECVQCLCVPSYFTYNQRMRGI